MLHDSKIEMDFGTWCANPGRRLCERTVGYLSQGIGDRAVSRLRSSVGISPWLVCPASARFSGSRDSRDAASQVGSMAMSKSTMSAADFRRSAPRDRAILRQANLPGRRTGSACRSRRWRPSSRAIDDAPGSSAKRRYNSAKPQTPRGRSPRGRDSAGCRHRRLELAKGCSYGTIMIDLERREVIDVLSDRSAEATAVLSHILNPHSPDYS